MFGDEEIARPDSARTSSAVANQHGASGPGYETESHCSPGCADGTVCHPSRAMAYLRNLAEELDARGLVASVLRAHSGTAFVLVVNPVATTMCESVTCAPTPAGLHDWYYWWSWGECLHRVNDPAGAASKVAHVLGALGAPAG
jgi:hypothetical protein